MGMFGNNRMMEYQNGEIKKLERNLKRFAEGDFDAELEPIGNAGYGGIESEQFKRINQYLFKIKESFNALDKDAGNMSENMREGNLNYRINTEKHKGAYSKIAGNINSCVEPIMDPFNETRASIEAMTLNDYTHLMEKNYKGDFAEFAKAVNGLNYCLKDTQERIAKIAYGDLNDIEYLRGIGKRCENDFLIPSFLKMLEVIDGLIEEVKMITEGIKNGNLDTRGDEEKFKGKYKVIMQGINGVVDAVAEPLSEIRYVLEELPKGNLNVSVKGNYKGEFARIADSTNELAFGLKGLIKDIDNALAKIARSDFSVENLRIFDGEYGNISYSVNTVIEKMNEVFEEIQTASAQVAAGAGQISDSSQTLSQGTEEQAASIEQISASIAEIAAQVKQNAANSSLSDELSRTAKNHAVKGNEQMKEMLQAMHDINESSSKISKIIKVIDDIAFQTNILALNAAVEAARAGQYGKGFAVVAEEVKNLAQQSANASKETTSMIETSIEKVNIGTKIANDTAEALNEIVESINKQSELGAQIASASNSQATAISQLNQAIDQVSQVIQSNSATAEESASASEELSSQAEMLKNLVDNVKLREQRKDMRFDDLGQYSPEIIKAVEDIFAKRSSAQSANAIARKEFAANVKPQILLDDEEFGKY